MLAVLLAVGLDPERSIIFHQDMVSTATCADRTIDPELSKLESRPRRTRMDLELHHAYGQAAEDDDVEGASLGRFVVLVAHRQAVQARRFAKCSG